MQSQILSYFPRRANPRPGQIHTLTTLEQNWDKGDVFVVVLATGGGKSLIAETIMRWANSQGKRSCTVVPNNVLLEQYIKGNPKLQTLRAKEHYTCSTSSTELYRVSCDGHSKMAKGKEKGKQFCKGCPYVAANRKVRAVPHYVVNTWTYMAHKLHQPVVVFDEAHSLLGMVREFAGKRLWQKDVPYPYNLKTYKDLSSWIAKSKKLYPQLEELDRDLRRPKSFYLVEKATEPLRGKMENCLKLLPIDTRNTPPFLWPKGPRGVQKVVLLSATISPQDIEQLGLAGRRVVWIESPAPIPAKQRPVISPSPGFRLGFDASKEELGRAAAEVDRLAHLHRHERGVIHLTYGLMDAFMPLLSEDTRKRLISHDRENKTERYKAFLEGPSDSILFCAGLQEGIDLPGDLGRWQVIAKVPWPSLGEPAWKYVAESDPVRYMWETMRVVLQASGRVCRGPEDYGITYILDRSFNNLDMTLAPTWFREGLVDMEHKEIER